MSEGPRNRSQGRISSGAQRSQSRFKGSAEGVVADAAAMRAARRRWTSGVAVVTTRLETATGTTYRGVTVSGFQPVSLDPPIVAVTLETPGTMEDLVQQSGVCAISVLDRSHEFLADRFAGLGPAPDSTFTGIAHAVAETGSPILTGALAWFDTTVRTAIEAGDHLLVLCDVVRIGLGEDTDDPLLNYEGGYRRIEG